MLVKVKLGDAQKFVKITELSLEEFLSAAFLKFGVPAVPENVKVFDESGTEVDDDVFEDVVIEPSVGVLTIKHGADLDSASPQASHGQSNLSLSSSIDSSDTQDTVIIEQSSSRKRMRLDDEAKKMGNNFLLVETILVQKPGGERIINEYNRTKSLGTKQGGKWSTSWQLTLQKRMGNLHDHYLVDICTSPPRQVKEKYARGIVTLFPYLSDPFSKNGYVQNIIMMVKAVLGQKRPGKVSASQAEKHLVVFKKSGTNIEEHFREITAIAQPCLLAVGPQKNSVHQYFIVLDQHAIPCSSALPSQ
ncbi:hypothetical protein Q7C36_005165 [Tachysurus vachellii]|uniref:Uncharacterized protein n=1 Tax=Tachysurus vachellii TaxID=175792 RepID=A0AA88NNH1_TACVA|nr:hypothetical protein Q7C36_005165 [Tachysurus vachellii]